jgi:hypothetical protein
MTEVRKFHPEVRLKKLLAEQGGVTAKVALERATENVESVRDVSMRAIDEKIETLTQLSNSDDPERMKKLYRVANEIFAESGTFGLAELSVAAHSLCSLLSTAEGARATPQAVAVHVSAMRALRKPEMAGDKAARGAVLAGLRGLTAKLAAAG